MHKKKCSESDVNEDLIKVLEESQKKFDYLNYKWKYLFDGKSSSQVKKNIKIKKSTSCENVTSCAMSVSVKDTDPTFKKLVSVDKRVAIANIKVDDCLIEQMALGNFDLSKERRDDLFRIINETVANKCDILVLPELSVPYQWLDLLTQASRCHNLAIICGLSYIVNSDRIAFNTVVSILPVKTKYYTMAFIVPRIKNHYSPLESRMLETYGYHLPVKSQSVYNLIHWRKSYFSVYNCFELASIEDRSLFKSKVDFIVATELNKDTNYYSEIIGSWVRDIHSFLIQVNTSNYGDSRISKPAKTEIRDQIIVKGGRNATMLYDIIEIDKLRKFQLPGYFGQDKLEDFKYTPPLFSKEDVEKRLKDEDFD